MRTVALIDSEIYHNSFSVGTRMSRRALTPGFLRTTGHLRDNGMVTEASEKTRDGPLLTLQVRIGTRSLRESSIQQAASALRLFLANLRFPDFQITTPKIQQVCCEAEIRSLMIS